MTKRLISILAVAVALLAVACASQRDNATAHLTPPDVAIRQLSDFGTAGRYVTGAVPIKFGLQITNRSAEDITLYQMRLESVGQGAYTLQPTQRPFEAHIAPEKTVYVEMWVPAVSDNTISGVNGPVSIRGTAYFHSDVGSFQNIFVKQINDGLGGQPSAK